MDLVSLMVWSDIKFKVYSGIIWTELHTTQMYIYRLQKYIYNSRPLLYKQLKMFCIAINQQWKNILATNLISCKSIGWYLLSGNTFDTSMNILRYFLLVEQTCLIYNCGLKLSYQIGLLTYETMTTNTTLQNENTWSTSTFESERT